MNKTHRHRVKDAVKKRRKYLWKKMSAKAMLALSIVILVPCVFALYVILANQALYDDVRIFIEWRSPDALMGVGTLGGLGMVVASGIWLYFSSRIRLHSLPHVPPLHEQIAALPAEEVLLRGSNQPAATPDALLRAAQAGAEADSQELLRAEPVRSDEQHTDAVQVQQTRS